VTDAALKAAALDLTPLMEPRHIAIVGASNDSGSIGARPLANLRRFGFDGTIDLVSRSSASIDGIACLPSVDALPRGVDTALLLVPRSAVEEVLSACIAREVRSAVIFTAGYSELGADGKTAQEQLAARALAAGMPISGPNGLGLINHRKATPLTFGWIEPASGVAGAHLAILSQSGAVAMALTYAAQSRGIALSYTVSTGNEAVLTLNDYLAYVLDDPSTKVVAILSEQIRQPRRFIDLCDRAAALGKPIVMFKLGRSERAKAAALSHTGSIAGDYEIAETVMRAHGVILAETMDALLDTAGLLARSELPKNSGIGLMSDSGALVTFALDQVETLDLEFPSVNPQTRAKLKELLPSFAHAENPVDVTTQGMNDPSLYGEVLAALIADDGCNSLAVFAMPGAQEHAVARAERLLPILQRAGKPIAYTILGGRSGDRATDFLQANGVAVFRRPEAALEALSRVARRGRFQRPRVSTSQQRTAAAALPAGVMTEHEAKTMLRARDFPVPEGRLVTDRQGLHDAASALGFPLALKIQSRQIIHKTELGCVALSISDLKAAIAAFDTMTRRVVDARPDAKIDGVLVERMGGEGIEIALGGRNDPEWGPVVMVALGGIWIEVMRDATLVPAPLDEAAARQALQRLRAFPLLTGVRGRNPADVEALARLIAATGELLAERPEIQELDFNPIVVFGEGEGALLLDASIVVEARPSGCC
jgi:acyl-CoA synthetase (NDP forming)